MSKIYVLLTKNKTVYNLKSTFLFLCICFISSNVLGQKTWVGIGSGSGIGTDFNSAANWFPAVVPTSSDNVTMNLIAAATINLSSSITINKLKLFLNGNNTVVKLNVGANLFTVNDSADIDIIAGNPNTELYIGVNDNTSAGTIDFKGNAIFGKTDQSGNGVTSKVNIEANNNSKIIFRGNLILGRLANINSGFEFGDLIFDGLGTQNFTNNSSRLGYSCSFKNVIVGSTNNPVVNLKVGLNLNNDDLLGKLTINGSSTLNIGISQWNRKTVGDTLRMKNTANLILSNSINGLAGSNFPANFSKYIFDSTSTVEFNGAAQTIPGAANAVYSYGNLTLSNGNIKTVGSKITIFRCLTLADNSTMALGDSDVVLKSNNVTTAYVATVPISQNFTYVTGRFVVERYLQAYQSWRLLATPIEIPNSPTVAESWREGNSAFLSTGYGTQITGPQGPIIASPTSIFDVFTQRISIKSYDANTDNYIPVTNSNTAPIANLTGYYVFVRGDRSVGITGSAGPTILRMRGKIRTGDQVFSVPVNKFQSIGNPFALQLTSLSREPPGPCPAPW